jgi:hypothetical protein
MVGLDIRMKSHLTCSSRMLLKELFKIKFGMKTSRKKKKKKKKRKMNRAKEQYLGFKKTY